MSGVTGETIRGIRCDFKHEANILYFPLTKSIDFNISEYIHVNETVISTKNVECLKNAIDEEMLHFCFPNSLTKTSFKYNNHSTSRSTMG